MILEHIVSRIICSLEEILVSYVKMDEITKNLDSIYKAVLIGAQRALEIAEEAAKQAKTLPEKPTTYAIRELESGKLKYKPIK